jgi:hypothetical protein
MFDLTTKIDNNRVALTKDEILKRVSEADLFKKYLNRDPSKKKRVTNPLRQDESPGCAFYTNDNNRLMFHDFALGQSWDCFGVVMEKYNLGFYDALKRINKDFSLRLNTINPVPEKYKSLFQVKKKKESSDLLYQIVVDDWDKDNLAYWKRFGIDKATLIAHSVYPVKYVYINKKLHWRSTEKNPIYGYVYPSGRLKCYRPLSPEPTNKWTGNATSEDINCYSKLPFLGKHLIITKSMKDALVAIKLGFIAIAPQGENNSLQTPKYQSLRHTFDKIVVLYDNDDPGITGANKASLEMECSTVMIPLSYGVKDLAEFREKYGPKKTKELLEKLVVKNSMTCSTKNLLKSTKA